MKIKTIELNDHSSLRILGRKIREKIIDHPIRLLKVVI
jgi:hypothetical protein